MQQDPLRLSDVLVPPTGLDINSITAISHFSPTSASPKGRPNTLYHNDDDNNKSNNNKNNNNSNNNNDNKISSNNSQQPRVKPKQKRNKPTLSCLECVERKTKCDRERPCGACVKRQSKCEYTAVANLIASSDQKNNVPSSKARHVMRPPPSKRAKTTAASPPSDNGWPSIIDGSSHWSSIADSHTGSPFLFSNVPYSQSSPSNVFGVGSSHPFSNYWTCTGGLPEVVSVLPSKDQADILVAKYFEIVDPVYPFLHRRTFYSDYELFWALPQQSRGETDASLVALHYAVYALGTQFMQFTPYEERSQTAEFYCSAANQALRVYSYLNRTSMRAIQAMLLMSYFLMNDNHASDAYAWAGIHLRQAYAMRLHRDPDIVVPEASTLEKQQRRKLWQSVFFQDTFLTILLKLPPTATHSDVPVESLADQNELSNDGLEQDLGAHSRVENLMSINVIAPQIVQPLAPLQPHHTLPETTMKADIAYMRSMWHLGNLVQENLGSPLSLSLPIAHSPKHKASLVLAFTRLYKTFPLQLTITTTTLDISTSQQTQTSTNNPRSVRQNLFLTSNYYHCLALLHASENPSAKVEPNVKAALEAAHEALGAFFKFWTLFEEEAGVWWAFQHRAFEESLMIAKFLAIPPSTDTDEEGQGKECEDGTTTIGTQSIYDKAKEDIRIMLEIMERYGGDVEMHKVRQEALHQAFQRIIV